MEVVILVLMMRQRLMTLLMMVTRLDYADVYDDSGSCVFYLLGQG